MEGQTIVEGNLFLGIEFGSTRIKAVLIDNEHNPVASGGYGWENSLLDGVWTYSLEDVWHGLQESFKELAEDVKTRYGVPLKKVKAIGISAMMHGYLVFDKNDNLLTPFRTWRNTITEQAAKALTEEFNFNIPQRWSIAHLYQAILNNESHVKDISFITTLAGYVHWKLTGEKVLGVGDASGMFPIDSETCDYNLSMAKKFDTILSSKGFDFSFNDIMPKVLCSGDAAGKLTAEGAKLLDPTGALEQGIPLCPPEGDAGTGMAATNSVACRTGNVSAGTSVFAMVVLEKELSKVYTEIDMVTTPDGKGVAMVHCNNCTSDIDAWVKLFGEAAEALGAKVDINNLYETMYAKALQGSADAGGLLSYNYYAGEPITDFDEGRLLFARTPDSRFSLANVMRSLLYSALGTLKIGMDILTDKEQVRLDQMLGHGGFFKVKGVGQNFMAAALNVPVTVMESAGEGGAWGIALLAAYMEQKSEGETLEEYLSQKVFAKNKGATVNPSIDDINGFTDYMKKYTRGLAIERAAVENM